MNNWLLCAGSLLFGKIGMGDSERTSVRRNSRRTDLLLRRNKNIFKTKQAASRQPVYLITVLIKAFQPINDLISCFPQFILQTAK